MPNYECIKVEAVDHVTTVTLSRPEKRNAMNPQLNNEMLDVLSRLAGLVNESVPLADLAERVHALTQDLRKRNPQTLVRDTERGRDKGLAQFLDTKEIKPGLQAYRREGD